MSTHETLQGSSMSVVYGNDGKIQSIVGQSGREVGFTLTANHAAEHIAMGNPAWQSGIPFWIPPGDGSAAGLRFTTDGSGAFTLSSAVISGLVVPSFYAYLPADAAYSGQAAGWYYGTMNSSTAGIIYANTYDATSQVPPTIPASPTALPTTGSPKYITQGLTEVTCCQKQVSSIGKNGSIEISAKVLSTSSATYKNIFILAGSGLLWTYGITTSGDMSGVVLVQNAGSESSQICTRSNTVEGGYYGPSINSDIKAVDLSAGALIKVSAQITVNTDSIFVYCRRISATYGA